MDDEEEDYDEDDFNLKKVERIEKDLIDLNEVLVQNFSDCNIILLIICVI